VDLIKVEGGPLYKQMMRASDTIYHGHTDMRELKGQRGWDLKQIPLSPESIRDNLPPWLGGPQPMFDALAAMLKALKAATESYIEEPLESALAIVAFPISPSFRKRTIATASLLSLRLFSTRWLQGGRMAWEAQSGVELCDEEDPVDDKLVLTVEYSRAALTGLVVEVMCNIMATARKLHYPLLGQDGFKTDATVLDLENALRDITSLPLKSDKGVNTKSRVFDAIVVLGEAADDVQLHEVLRKVLGEQYHVLMKNNLKTSTTDSPQNLPFPRHKIDPLYAASQGAAYDCWYRLKAIEAQGGPCKLGPESSYGCVEYWADNRQEDSETD